MQYILSVTTDKIFDLDMSVQVEHNRKYGIDDSISIK
jgi:hypothetical protein